MDGADFIAIESEAVKGGGNDLKGRIFGHRGKVHPCRHCHPAVTARAAPLRLSGTAIDYEFILHYKSIIYNQSRTSSSSTLKTRAAQGGMAAPAPASP